MLKKAQEKSKKGYTMQQIKENHNIETKTMSNNTIKKPTRHLKNQEKFF